MKQWVYLIAAILFEVAATLSLKGALDYPVFYLVVAGGYFGAFAAIYAALQEGLPLGVGYGIWAASGVALTAVASMLIFGEPLTGTMIIGIVMVMAGVLLIEIGSQSAARKQALELETASHPEMEEEGQ